MRSKAILLAALLAMTLAPAMATAQAPTASFAALARNNTLEKGQDITITFRYEASTGYEEVKAEVIRMNVSTITIMVDTLPQGRTDLPVNRREGRYGRWEIEIPEHRVQNLVLEGEGMPRWAGGLIGAGAGIIGQEPILTIIAVVAIGAIGRRVRGDHRFANHIQPDQTGYEQTRGLSQGKLHGCIIDGFDTGNIG